MKIYLILAVLAITMFGCKKHSQNTAISLSGEYVETVPTLNGDNLNFISSNQVTIRGGEVVNQTSLLMDTFTYQITNNIITFIPKSPSQSSTTYLIDLLGSSYSFSLNPCTCACPCANSHGFVFAKKP